MTTVQGRSSWGVKGGHGQSLWARRLVEDTQPSGVEHRSKGAVTEVEVAIGVQVISHYLLVQKGRTGAARALLASKEQRTKHNASRPLLTSKTIITGPNQNCRHRFISAMPWRSRRQSWRSMAAIEKPSFACLYSYETNPL